MAGMPLTGSRIRERRLLQGLRQTQLAKEVGVSPSYLNLIEHNRRRIGGKLLLDIAAALKVEPSLLAEGAEAALITRLRASAAEAGEEGAELAQVEEFAGRFPGWARLLAAQRRRIAALERSVEVLTDRLTHDPHLAATLHEVLSTVTAIRASASILVETREIEPEWRDRFHRNINEDARRLAEGAQALVGYLDDAPDAGSEMTAPQEEVEAFLAARSYHFEALEAGEDEDGAGAIVAAAEELGSASAVAQATVLLQRYAVDARAVPLDDLRDLVAQSGPDPETVAERFGVDPAAAMRRLASLPELKAGLVACDGSGTMTLRKPVEGFALPRFGAACPLWPLFRALNRPMVLIHELLEQPGRAEARRFVAFAVALPRLRPAFNREPFYEAHMMLLPASDTVGKAEPVGSSCRVCPRAACALRREPSIMVDGF